MKKVIQYIILLLLVSNICWGQTFIKCFGTRGITEQATYVSSLRNGAVIISGFRENSSTQKSGLLLNLNSNGTINWFKEYNGNSLEATINCVKPMADGFLATGWVSGTADTVWALKTDLNGNVLWSRKYQNTNSSKGLRVEVINANHAIITGVEVVTQSESRGLIIDINPSNSLIGMGQMLANQWLQYSQTYSTGINTYFGDIKRGGSDNEYFISGFSSERSGSRVNHPILTRLNGNGSTLNAARFPVSRFVQYRGGSKSQGSYSLEFDGNALFTSGNYWYQPTELGLYFMRIDNTATLNTETHVLLQDNESPRHNIRSNNIRAAFGATGNVTNLVSPISDESSNKKAGLVLVDNTINIQWSRFFDSPGEDYTTDATPLGNSGYMAVGYTSITDGSATDILVIRTDVNGDVDKGNLDCFKQRNNVLNPIERGFVFKDTLANEGDGFTPLQDTKNSSDLSPKDRHCPPPPCNCFSTPKITLFAGHPKLNPPSEQLSCNNSEIKKIECNKLYYILAEPSCTQGCTGTIDSIKWVKNNIPIGIVKSPDIMLPILVTESGNYEAWVYSICGDKTCGICKIKFTATCTCPPPECCKDKPGVEGNSINVSQVNGGTQFMANLAITGNSATGYKEVRLQVMDVQIGSENNNIICIDCLKNPRQWGSITSALMQGFSTTLATATGNNREAVLTANSAQTMQGKSLVFNLLLPPKSTLECCKLYADIYIRITLRDDQCRECETIISGRVYLTDLKWGAGENGNDDNNDNPTTNDKKANRLFPNQKQLHEIPNQRVIKSQILK